MIRLLLLVIFIFTASAAENADFDAANRLYEKGEFAGAIAAYQKLANNHQASPALLFNLGNAHFKNGQIGRAIFSYRHAELLAPRDPDIRANLRFALGSVPGNNTRVSRIDRALQTLTLNELGTLTALALWVCFGCLATIQLRPQFKNALKGYAITAGISALLFGAWFTQSALTHTFDKRAVVIVPTSVARFGPLEESQVSFNVRDGNELKIIGQKDNWLQVADPSNRTGWISAADVAQLP